MKNILLGNNAQYYKLPFAAFVDAQKKLGITAVDLSLLVPHIYVDSYKVLDSLNVGGMLCEHGIRVPVLTPPPYRYSICAGADTIQHEKTMGYYRQCILLAEKLGASFVTITASGANFDEPKEILFAQAEKTLKELSAFAGVHGVILLLGTVPGEESPCNASSPVLLHLDEVKQMLGCVSSPYLNAYLDTEVISLTGETISQWFAALGSAIQLVRFTDGNYNGYRAWGRGCLPCSKYLRELQKAGYEGPLSLQIPGDRYSDRPTEMQQELMDFLRGRMAEVD